MWRSKTDPASDAYIEEFYNETPIDPSWRLDEKTAKIKQFLDVQKANGVEKVAIVTSGSVAVSLDESMVLYMDTLGSGHRGAVCAEQFLRRKYAVVFLYRIGSLKPFSRLFAKQIKEGSLLDRLKVNEETGRVEVEVDSPLSERIQRMLLARTWYKDRLLEVDFEESHQYLFLLREAAMAAAPFGDRALLFLTAGLIKRHIPTSELKPPREAPAATYEEPLKFAPLPHVLRKLRTSWCPRAYTVTFKLEDDPILLSERAHRQMERWGPQLVVGNVVTTRRKEVLLVTEREELRLVADLEEELEASLTKAVVEYHKQNIQEREAMDRSKPLLVLSAKFCMMRENVSVVDEDADGNKNVPFKVGVRIKANRRAADSPVYVLRSVLKNKSGSARCQLWEKEAAPGEEGEIIVAFSPAGTPDTVVYFLSDVWSGWLEEEVKNVREGVKQIPLTSYLNILASPVTGDFSELTTLWDGFIKSVLSAWREGEKPRVVQAMRNLLLLGFDRGLSTIDGLLPAEVLHPHVDRQVSEDPFNVSSSAYFKAHASRVKQSFVREVETEDEEDLVAMAGQVRVHSGIRKYYDDMISSATPPPPSSSFTTTNDDGGGDDPFMSTILDAYRSGSRVVVTGYSMGGMLSQLFVLHLGEALVRSCLLTDRVTMVTFGSPRVGDEGFKARLKLLYRDETRLMNVVYPLDTVHAFPPVTEGYSDAGVKIFLRQKGQFVARRYSSKTNLTPIKWLRVVDSKIDDIVQANRRRRRQRTSSTTSPAPSRVTSPLRGAAIPSPERGNGGGRGGGGDGSVATTPTISTPQSSSEMAIPPACGFCGMDTHATEQHRCHLCTERGSHRGTACPNRDAGCKLCGRKDHATGEHICGVCKLTGHRGRDCHSIGDVGIAELSAYFSFHDYIYTRRALDYLLGEEEAGGEGHRRRNSATDLSALAAGRQTPTSLGAGTSPTTTGGGGEDAAAGGGSGGRGGSGVGAVGPRVKIALPDQAPSSSPSSMPSSPKGSGVVVLGEELTDDDLESLNELNRF